MAVASGLMLGAIATLAAVPALEHLYPAGGAMGSTNLVTLSGKFDPWPPRFWVEGEGVSITATTNAGKVEVSVAADAHPGPRWVRAHNGEGGSEPRLFVVADSREAVDLEPNNAFARPQALSALPVTVEGRLDRNGDVDCFGVVMRAGDWLEARVDAYTLLSKLDAVLRVVGTNGLPLAWNHDFETLDPRVVWQAPTAQSVVVQVFGFKYPADAAIQLTGGEGAVYRLHLAAHPECPDPPASEASDASVPAFPWSVRSALSDQAPEGRHRFRAKKDDLLEFRVAAASLGAGWDARLRIEDAGGKELAQNDDAEGTPDPRLEWRTPADGEYVAVVGSRTRKRSARPVYELAIDRVMPSFRATSAVSAMVMTAGTTNDWKIPLLRRNGFTNEVAVGIEGLPEGVTAAEERAAAGGNEVTLRLVAVANSSAFSGPIRIYGVPKGLATTNWVEHDLVSRGENNGVPQGYSRLLRNSIDTFWLTVREAASGTAGPARP